MCVLRPLPLLCAAMSRRALLIKDLVPLNRFVKAVSAIPRFFGWLRKKAKQGSSYQGSDATGSDPKHVPMGGESPKSSHSSADADAPAQAPAAPLGASGLSSQQSRRSLVSCYNL